MDYKGATILKIALTGHSRGFGPYIQQKLEELGHEIVGFSRSNGYDLSTSEGRIAALKESEDCEVFINNSTIGGYQSNLLVEWLNYNRSSNKKIINISSYLANIQNPVTSISLEWINKKNLEEVHKNFKHIQDYHIKCDSKLLSWGYWKQHKFSKYHPEVITNMKIDDAIQDLVDVI